VDLSLGGHRCCLLFALACLPLVGGCGGEGEAVRIVWLEDRVEVHGLDAAALPGSGLSGEDFQERFTVHTVALGKDGEDAPVAEAPPVAGGYALTEGVLRFTPAFPFAPGQRYVARWRTASGGTISAAHTVPKATVDATTEVAGLHPSGPTLPANVLRLYLHFSAPMNVGEARHHLRLLRLTEGPSGPGAEPVPEPFVAPEVELWDDEHRRLTLLFDPGRIKQGVGPHEALGAVLEPGARYRLEIDAAWRDARGAPLRGGFQHTFSTTAADREPPAPARWRITPPTHSGEALEITFPEPLDRALLHHCLTVEGPDGQPLPGQVEIPPGERQWRFQPTTPWSPGSYRIHIEAILEDPSGNRIGRPFDAPLGLADEAGAEAEPPVLEFTFAP